MLCWCAIKSVHNEWQREFQWEVKSILQIYWINQKQSIWFDQKWWAPDIKHPATDEYDLQRNWLVSTTTWHQLLFVIDLQWCSHPVTVQQLLSVELLPSCGSEPCSPISHTHLPSAVSPAEGCQPHHHLCVFLHYVGLWFYIFKRMLK